MDSPLQITVKEECQPIFEEHGHPVVPIGMGRPWNRMTFLHRKTQSRDSANSRRFSRNGGHGYKRVAQKIVMVAATRQSKAPIAA